MKFLFKQSYDTDINLLPHSGYWRSSSAFITLAVIIPFLFLALGISPTQMGFLVEILCFSIGCMGLMILTGYTGQVSLGHEAFFALGAYISHYLVQLSGGWLPLLGALPFTMIIMGLFGYAIARPTLRMTSVALAISTLLLMILTQQFLFSWEAMGRDQGFDTVSKSWREGWFADALLWIVSGSGPLPALVAEGRDMRVFQIKGISIYTLYFVSLAALIAVIWMMKNITRSSVGRIFIAIRDSETSARSMGVNIEHYKSLAFALSAAITALGGALYAVKCSTFTPEHISFVQSIVFLLIVVIGGLGSIHGAIFGSIAYVLLRELIMPGISRWIRDLASESNVEVIQEFGLYLGSRGNAIGDIVFAVILILLLAAEPLGLYARWKKSEAFFQTFPFYRAGTFKRQRAYAKTERLK